MKPRFADRVRIPKPWTQSWDTDISDTFKNAGWTPPSEAEPNDNDQSEEYHEQPNRFN